MTVSPPAYQTRLSKEPLAEILARLAFHKVAASVRCREQSRTRNLFVSDARLDFACTSDDPIGAFGQLIVERGLATFGDFDLARSRTLQTRNMIASDLVSTGKVDESKLNGLVGDHAKTLISEIFGWTDGVVEVRPGRTLLPIRLGIPIVRVVLDGVRRYGDPKLLTSRIGPRTTILKRSEGSSDDLTAGEKELLAFIDGRRSLEEVVRHPSHPPQENVRIIYGFHELDLVAPKESGVRVKVKLKE
ncbi:MAG: hypothetical protein KY459_00735 [Acidobacteria bacterium]|nr:hypothetical protein [Acidobacteriota bacterium]